MPVIYSDYVIHPPSGSSYPGKEDANPYRYYPPSALKKLVETEKDPEELAKIRSALKQWERQYVYPGYPWRVSSVLRRIASQILKFAEVPHPSINIPYYQDAPVPEGLESILKGLKNIHDDDHMREFDYARQGERPRVDIDTGRGDFLSPSEPPIGDTVKTKGEGPDPDIEYPFPPTGGNLGAI